MGTPFPLHRAGNLPATTSNRYVPHLIPFPCNILVYDGASSAFISHTLHTPESGPEKTTTGVGKAAALKEGGRIIENNCCLRETGI